MSQLTFENVKKIVMNSESWDPKHRTGKAFDLLTNVVVSVYPHLLPRVLDHKISGRLISIIASEILDLSLEDVESRIAYKDFNLPKEKCLDNLERVMNERNRRTRNS